MIRKSKGPRFKVGQVVMKSSGVPMKIDYIDFHLKGQTGIEEYRYMSLGYYSWESTLRTLRKHEIGEARRSK